MLRVNLPREYALEFSMLSLLLCVLTLTQDPSTQIDRLGDPDPAVRDAAAETLFKGGRSSIPLLTPLVDGADVEVAGRAGSILRRIGRPAMVALGNSASEKLRALSRAIARDEAGKYLSDGTCYRVEWSEPAPIDAGRELLRSWGSGHGFILVWQVFRPKEDGVEILSFEYRGGRKSYDTKWAPDEAPVFLQKATLPKDDYEALLRIVGVIRAASLVEVNSNRGWGSSGNFYVFVRIPEAKDGWYQEEYAGYSGSLNERTYSKPRAMETLLNEALKPLTWTKAELTAADRGWVSRKFADDWGRINGRQFYWWVMENALKLVGCAGDASSLPLLAEIIRDGDPKDRKTYYAINAATRLSGIDVREKPVEQMDVEATRAKLLPLLEKK